MIRLYAVNILPLRDRACFENCYRRSVKERREKADMLQMPSDKARCIAAGLLLEYAYQKYRTDYIKELARANSFGYARNAGSGKVPTEEFLPEYMPEIREGLRGKPEFWVQDKASHELFFNLSHSGNYVICVLANFEVGADIQKRTHVRESVLRHFFSKEEQLRVENCGGDEFLRERTFAQIWTTKEAEAKLTGRGMEQMMERLLKNITQDRPEEERKYRIWQGGIDEEYVWAVAGYPEATEEEPEHLEPLVVDEGELFYEGMF